MCHSNLGCNDGHATTQPHFDVYVDGDFAATATTVNSRAWTFERSPPGGEYISEWIGRKHLGFSGIDGGYARLYAKLDEVRFWQTARTQSQIQECMYQELGIEGGNCSIGYNLAAYWRFYEGSGKHIIDSSYGGNHGDARYCYSFGGCWAQRLWYDPYWWTTGYPF